jgi:replicative DNA helicase
MNIDVIEQKHSHTMAEAAMAAIEKAQATAKNDGVTGLPTGLSLLDKAIGGFQSPDLYVIGARPAMGKTSVILNMMLNHDSSVGFFSTEQPADQIGLRAISATSAVSARKIRIAEFSHEDETAMSMAVFKLASSKIHIYDKGYLHINELMREARRMKYNFDVGAIYVDYIQRIKSGNKERRLEVAEVVTSLKSLARELKIPVIGLAQVNRKVEERNDKRPHMGDLLESGVVEQEADVVMLLYRDEVYNPQAGEKGVIEILIDKNRHGPTGNLKFAWLPETMQIKDLYAGAPF